MLRVWAHHYVQMGEFIQTVRGFFVDGKLNPDKSDLYRFQIGNMLVECRKLNLGTSTDLLQSRLDKLPQTLGEFEMLADAMQSELSRELFCYVPSHLARYYDSAEILTERARGCFPKASAELVEAGTALAAGLSTAAVFHAMRAAEIGTRTLANDLEVAFPDKALEFAELQQILGQIDLKIWALSQLPRTEGRARDQEFYSAAASQFRYFKDGWRVRAAHAREGFTELEAKRAIDHACDFFDTLSERLAE